jgi:hypothetical protein
MCALELHRVAAGRHSRVPLIPSIFDQRLSFEISRHTKIFTSQIFSSN